MFPALGAGRPGVVFGIVFRVAVHGLAPAAVAMTVAPVDSEGPNSESVAPGAENAARHCGRPPSRCINIVVHARAPAPKNIAGDSEGCASARSDTPACKYSSPSKRHSAHTLII